MQKSVKKGAPKPRAARATPAKSPQPAVTEAERNEASSKQARVITMLQSPAGMTIAAMMKETGWQHHSVRGFLAGVVRKKLKLQLSSKKIDGNRVYCIGEVDSAKPTGRQSKRGSA
jgi:hypothetical protein